MLGNKDERSWGMRALGNKDKRRKKVGERGRRCVLEWGREKEKLGKGVGRRRTFGSKMGVGES